MIVIPFDSKGALTALAFFLGIFLVLAAIFLVNLRRERLGRFGLSRQVRIVGFAILAVAYAAVLYGWLFWRTFYELRVEPSARRMELTVLIPERQLSWPLDRIASVRQVAGSRAGFARLLVETRDGRSYRSPDRRTSEIAATLRKLEVVSIF